MFDVDSLRLLTEDELIKLYELFFGPVLIRKSSDSYIASLKTVIDNPEFMIKLLDKLNPLERNILNYLSSLPGTHALFLNEKLSILIGEHPSIIGKAVHNLHIKNYLILKDNYYVLPQFLKKMKNIQLEFNIQKNEVIRTYNNVNMSAINNIILYFLSVNTVFSKNGTLYKKDYETLISIFGSSVKFEKIEYDIIANFCYMTFISNDSTDWNSVRTYFELDLYQQALKLLTSVFSYLSTVFSKVNTKKTDCSFDLNQYQSLYHYFLLASELSEEPFRISQEQIIEFMKKIGIINQSDDMLTILYYSKSEIVPMNMKLSSNYSIYINSDTSDKEYYLNAIYSHLIRYDKIAEFEISDISIRRAIRDGFTYNDFMDFLKSHDVIPVSNVELTIHDWFEKHSSYYTLEGTIFLAETEDKGRIINKLIENKFITAFEVKKNAIFFIPEEHKESFFDFLTKSKIHYYKKRTSNHSKIAKHTNPHISPVNDIIKFC